VTIVPFWPKDFEFKIKKEKVLETINHGSKFHILTYFDFYGNKGIRRYTFENAEYSRITYDLSDNQLTNEDNYPIPLYQAFDSQAELIDSEVPTSIDIASKNLKIYLEKDKLLITLDRYRNTTKIISLDLKSNAVGVANFETSESDRKKQITNSNSFVHKNNLFQLALSKDSLWLRITDKDSRQLRKEFKNDKESEITFKNSPIYQEGSLFLGSNQRELEQNKQLLRKMRKSRIGVSVFQINDMLELSLGGVKDVARGSAPMMMPMNPVPVPGVPVEPIMITPVFGAYQSYTSSRAVFVKSLLDKNTLDHLQGDAGKNVFERLKDFTDELDPKLETTFRYKNFLIYGYYRKGEYHLVKFRV
ncbi:MAG: hypothetical protein AAGA86_00845, partial [Bacteroidota bacterium]